MAKWWLALVVTVAALFSGGCGLSQTQPDKGKTEKTGAADGKQPVAKEEVKLEQFANPGTKMCWGIADRIADVLLKNNLYQKKF